VRIKQEGNTMKTTLKTKNIEQLLVEADELLQQIDPEILEYLEEEQRAQLEEHAQSLKKLKFEVNDKNEKEQTPESGSYSEGTHEAIQDIVKAIETMSSYLSPRKKPVR
jgi:hypothetical protein